MGFVVPLHHPLRLAEEIAIVDQMSGGRFECGLVPGISPGYFTPFGMLTATERAQLVARGILLAAGAIVLPLLLAPAGLALALAFGSEILGRYLFFVSVVPKHMAAPYIPVESEAA